MKERLDEACDKLRRLIRNPFAVQRYLQKDYNVQKCWADLAKSRRK